MNSVIKPGWCESQFDCLTQIVLVYSSDIGFFLFPTTSDFMNTRSYIPSAKSSFFTVNILWITVALYTCNYTLLDVYYIMVHWFIIVVSERI